MRKIYRNALKECFHAHLSRTRADLGMTQAQMAECLVMDDRSYLDLDHGKSCCSAITLALYLIYVCEDVNAFLEELRLAFQTAVDTAA